jgi:GH15 family glucan-1,4-alpha-glucosidase
MTQPSIRDLGLVGNRRTLAGIDRLGNVVWYCPGRFDRASLFASLLDPAAGSWRIHAPDAQPLRRRYIGESAVLETEMTFAGDNWRLTDWMPLGAESAMLCRQFGPAPDTVLVEIRPRPDYGQRAPHLTIDRGGVVIDGTHHLYSSEPAGIDGDAIHVTVPTGAAGWFVLSDGPLQNVSEQMLAASREATLRCWDALHWQTRYGGPYERQVKDSLRALRLLTFEDNGGIIAAGTLGLPEVIGGSRNYDYRYVWLRDAAMIVSALVRAGSEGTDERRFLGFLCAARREREDGMPLPPFVTLDGEPPPPPCELPWEGYRGSRPVLTGNGAGQQLQLDGLGNVLLAAKLIYNRYQTREHWETVERIADFLAAHWREPDHGIWEEPIKRQFTSSKIIASRSLRFIANHASTLEQAKHWCKTADAIDGYVHSHCLTRAGAYAVFEGSEAVDVTAALFPEWAYCAPDSPEMLATMARLERDYSRDGLLYWRHLECLNGQHEGVFLAGTLWVAQYWVMRNELKKAERILEAVLAYANDLGLLPEEAEADPDGGEMLGNLPQAFVHAALVGLAVDLKAAHENLQ